MRWKGQGAIKIGDGTSGEPKLFSTFFRVVAICRKSIHCPELVSTSNLSESHRGRQGVFVEVVSWVRKPGEPAAAHAAIYALAAAAGSMRTAHAL